MTRSERRKRQRARALAREKRRQQRLEFIEENYPRKGGAWVAKRLGISAHHVRALASAHGVPYGLTNSRVVVNKVARLAGHTWDTVRKAAEADGVLTRVTNAGSKRKLVTVPLNWADAYVERAVGQEHATLVEDGWLTSRQLGRELNLSQSYITSTRKHGTGPMGDFLRGIEAIEVQRGSTTRVYFHPRAAAEAAAQLARLRRQADNMVSVLELSKIITSVQRPMITKRMRACDSYAVLPAGGRVMGHVSHEHAQEIMAHYGVYHQA